MEKQADLTREQILAMEPGIELDALVAEKVLGMQLLSLEEAIEKFANAGGIIMHNDGAYINPSTDLVFNKTEYDRNFDGIHYAPCRNQWLQENATVRLKTRPYSTDISAAWKVVEKIEGIEDANWVCGDNMSPDGKRDGYAFRIYFPSGVTDEIGNMEFDEVDGVGGSVPEAICKVALIATL